MPLQLLITCVHCEVSFIRYTVLCCEMNVLPVGGFGDKQGGYSAKKMCFASLFASDFVLVLVKAQCNVFFSQD